MGFSRKRTGRDGGLGYTAYYRDIRGEERSAGTFARKKEADDAWKAAEAAVSAGKRGDPSRGLVQAVTVREVLAASFDAFEAIRITARDHQDQVPGLSAAFMTTADAAVDGREAVTIAPSLPRAGGTGPCGLAAAAGAGQAAEIVAGLAIVLRDRLTGAAHLADTPGDRAACQDAAEAAGRICQLMTR